MIHHAVGLVIKRFYTVYVADGDMTQEQIVAKAKKMALDSPDNLVEDVELDIEEEDRKSVV